MKIRFARNWSKGCFLAAAAFIASEGCIASAQSTIVEPEGVPVYREKRSGFFQNPFSNTYQRLWSKAKASTQPTRARREVAQPTATVEYAEGNYLGDVETKPRSRGLMDGLFGRSTHTVKKPTSPVASQHAERIIHVNDVNEGTPQVGVETEVDASEELIRSLSEGESIVSVKERVVGIYRDGKLVPLPQGEPTADTADEPEPARSIDPWFGDEVPTPSREIQKMRPLPPIDGKLPPASLDQSGEFPVLPPEVAEVVVEQTTYLPQPTRTANAAVPNGTLTVLSAEEAEKVMTQAPKRISPEVLRKYQTGFSK